MLESIRSKLYDFLIFFLFDNNYNNLSHGVTKALGVLTYLAERGCAALMGRFFYKKSLNMGPAFYPKNP